MTDDTGMIQHASYTIPNYREGYSSDDIARALIVAVFLEEDGEDDYAGEAAALATRHLAFLWNAFNPANNRFRNFLSYDRRWLEEVGSEDCHGHALWALGLCVAQSGQGSFQMLAAQLFELALPAAADFTSPRAWAFTLIGIDEYLRRLSGDRRVTQFREALTAKLVQRYSDAATDDFVATPAEELMARYDRRPPQDIEDSAPKTLFVSAQRAGE